MAGSTSMTNPRIQLLTIKNLLGGKSIDYPRDGKALAGRDRRIADGASNADCAGKASYSRGRRGRGRSSGGADGALGGLIRARASHQL